MHSEGVGVVVLVVQAKRFGLRAEIVFDRLRGGRGGALSLLVGISGLNLAPVDVTVGEA